MTGVAKQRDPKRFCAIIYVGSFGSSWGYGATMQEAADKAAERCVKDWPSLPKQRVTAHAFISPAEWYAEPHGIFDKKTGKQIMFKKAIDVTL